MLQEKYELDRPYIILLPQIIYNVYKAYISCLHWLTLPYNMDCALIILSDKKKETRHVRIMILRVITKTARSYINFPQFSVIKYKHNFTAPEIIYPTKTR